MSGHPPPLPPPTPPTGIATPPPPHLHRHKKRKSLAANWTVWGVNHRIESDPSSATCRIDRVGIAVAGLTGLGAVARVHTAPSPQTCRIDRVGSSCMGSSNPLSTDMQDWQGWEQLQGFIQPPSPQTCRIDRVGSSSKDLYNLPSTGRARDYRVVWSHKCNMQDWQCLEQ